jgi:hypothetical protein
MPTTTNNGWPTPADTDLVKNGADAIRDLGQAIDTTLGVYVASTPGLTKISTTTFSAVSSQSFNDVFSATYDTYVIRGSYVGSADGGCDIRLRVSGADNSAANYERQLMNVSNASTSFTRITGQTSYTGALSHTTTYNGVNIVEFHRPFATSPTLAIFMGNTEGGSTDTRAVNQFMKHTTSTSFTGFSVLVSSGTITGSITVYGYNK